MKSVRFLVVAAIALLCGAAEMPEHATRTEDAMSDPSTWLALDYQRVTGTCVQPLLPDGAWIGVDHDATAGSPCDRFRRPIRSGLRPRRSFAHSTRCSMPRLSRSRRKLR